MRTFLHLALILILPLTLVKILNSANTDHYLKPRDRTNGKATLRAFSVIDKSAKMMIVKVLSGKEEVAFGTIVSSPGYILTKASELKKGILEVILPDGRQVKARMIGKDPSLDLALIFVDGEELNPIRWGRSTDLKIGDWLISPGQEDRSWIGVMSAKRRKIKRMGGALGVSLGQQKGRQTGVKIIAVFEDSPADLAGIQKGDLVLKVEDQIMTNHRELINRIQEYDPGDEITLMLTRGQIPFSVQVKLGFYSMFDPWNRNQRMSGETSNRRSDFPEVIQHVIPLTPDSMGSPLLNLRGETLGINIARADRVTTYAVPSERVIPSLQRMIDASPQPLSATNIHHD